MSDEDRADSYSGIPWVQVAPHAARAHPKGQLNAVLYAIVAYLLLSGLAKTTLYLVSGFPVWAILLGGLLPVLAGLGLWARMPWALVVTVVMAGATLYSFVRNLRAEPDLLLLVDAVIAIGILLYLLEGDRPNFVYRHRYRKYSALKSDDPDEPPTG